MNSPSRGRKLAFWILVGMISVVFVEVPAGSTMFPFWTTYSLRELLPGPRGIKIFGLALFIWYVF